MKLHCQICSIQGTHTSEDSEIATIDIDKLTLPLAPEMFTSVNPEREIPTPWLTGVDWLTMKCPRGNHLPWGITHDKIDQAMKDGGPAQLLTDQGLIDVVPAVSNEVAQPKTTECPICGRVIQNKGFQNHYKACAKK